MAVFTAFAPANINNLQAIGQLANFASFNMTGVSANGFTLTSGQVQFVVGGSIKFFPIGNVINPGTSTVTSLLMKAAGANQYQFTGFSIPLAVLDDFSVPNILAGNDTLNGSSGVDQLNGFGGNDLIKGNAGNDILKGGNGNDGVIGGAGVDTLKGEAGNDTINSGKGADIMFGGAGADKFIFNVQIATGDRIEDLKLGADKVVLENEVFDGIGADNSILAAGRFLKDTEPTNGAACIIYDVQLAGDPTHGALLYDSNGNGAGGRVRFALVDDGLGLKAGDFLIT